MLDAEQLDNWNKDVATVREYVRRAEKGLPEDRWTDGVNGARKLAKGCHGLLSLIAAQAEANAVMLAQIYRTGEEAMEPSADPMRGDRT